MNNAPSVEIIATGSELLSGKGLNTNAAWLSREFTRRGFQVIRHQTLGDEKGPLVDSVRLALAEADVLVLTGGLGPTLDDITREVLTEATGIALRFDEEAAEQIRERFRALGKVMPELNLVQAQVPEQGGWLSNPHGTAPGLWFDLGSKLAVALPGPPRELIPMVDTLLWPLLERRFAMTRKLLARSLRVAGFGESNVEEVIRPLVQSSPELTYSILAQPGLVEVTLSRWADRETESDTKLDEVFSRMVERLGPVVYTTEGLSLEEVIGQMLRERHATAVTAESCTGGLIAESLTRVSGSSEYFLGAIVAYSNALKIALLGVEPALIEAQGAVSAPVARAMAEGARKRTGADYAISVTGIAGPTGGSEEKPVGCVFIGVSGPEKTVAEKFQFFGSREAIRERSRVVALNQLRLMMRE